jgi:hypothetical protein
MARRYPVLTTVEEDFRAIGLLTEADDASKPRTVASPDPDTLAGLDDSEGDKEAHSDDAKQPKPKLGPDDDDEMDPLEDGGSVGAQKGGGSKTVVKGSKEASLRGEAREVRPIAPYTVSKKKVGLTGTGKAKGEAAKIAVGRKKAKAKMKSEGVMGRAANLIEEVEGLLHGIQIDEDVDNLLRGFRLVSEDAALLADRMTEISDVYDVEEAITAMEELSTDAAEAIDIIEQEIEDLGDGSEEDEAVANSAEAAGEMGEGKLEGSDRDPNEVYSVNVASIKESGDLAFQAMVGKLMSTLEAYDYALDEITEGEKCEGEDCDDDESEAEHKKHVKKSDKDNDEDEQDESVDEEYEYVEESDDSDDDDDDDEEDDKPKKKHAEPDDDNKGGKSDDDEDNKDKKDSKGSFADRMAALRSKKK